MILSKRQKPRNVGEKMEKGELLCTVGRNVKLYNHTENNSGVSQKTKNMTSTQSSNPIRKMLM
jgi:hypothetical protein